MNCIGIDIGGANIKVSDSDRSISEPFALWKGPHELPQVLRGLLQRFPDQPPLAVTMTGELADCFERREFGVRMILDSVEQAAPSRRMAVWCTAGEFLTADQAREFPTLVAAANWHALASWAGRMSPAGGALLIDVGSTTTDIIPIEQGVPMPAGRTDVERLVSGELVYLGARRTPVCSLVAELPLRGVLVPVMREVFATSLDVELLLGLREEAGDDGETANGRPATRAEAAIRLARQIGCDVSITCTEEGRGGGPVHEKRLWADHRSTDLEESELLEMAQSIRHVQRSLIHQGLQCVVARMVRPLELVLFSGEGEPLGRESLNASTPLLDSAACLSLADLLGAEHSRAACAYALSRLGMERLG